MGFCPTLKLKNLSSDKSVDVEPEREKESELVEVISREECNEPTEPLNESFRMVNETDVDTQEGKATYHPELAPVKQFPDAPIELGDVENVGPRRSKRQVRLPDKLHYARLGNPLVSVIQSLLQGLSSALSESVEESEYIKHSCELEPSRVLPV